MILKRKTNSKEVNTTPINLTNWKDQVRNATPQHRRGNILLQVRDDDHEKKDKWQTGKHNSHKYNETEGEKDVIKDGDILEGAFSPPPTMTQNFRDDEIKTTTTNKQVNRQAITLNKRKEEEEGSDGTP